LAIGIMQIGITFGVAVFNHYDPKVDFRNKENSLIASLKNGKTTSSFTTARHWQGYIRI
jgi:hypothetical protein